MATNIKTDTQLLPLAVDLDGTLCHTDTLFEGLMMLLRFKPLQFFKSLGLLGNRVRLKRFVFQHVQLDLTILPWNQPLIDYLREQRIAGRLLCLATAADYSIAQGVADYLDLFDKVVASSDRINLKGAAKAGELRTLFGERKFVYAGDARADFRVWECAAAAIVIGDLLPQYLSDVYVPVEVRFAVTGSRSLRGKLLRTYMWLVDR